MSLGIVSEADARAYRASGAWGDTTVADLVEQWSAERPHADAYVTASLRMTWSQYHDRAQILASEFVRRGFPRGARVGVLMPDGPAIHVVLIACELAGITAVGIGNRAGPREITHLLGKSPRRRFRDRRAHRSWIFGSRRRGGAGVHTEAGGRVSSSTRTDALSAVRQRPTRSRCSRSARLGRTISSW